MRALVVLLACVAVPGAACSPRFAVDGQRAHARVVQQVDMGPRIPGSEGHQAFRTWLRGEIERLGGRIETQAFLDTVAGREMNLTNVIARFGPKGGRPILLAAHYDTRAWADRDTAGSTIPVPGANDAASGVAVLLEVAELMHQKPPPRGVELVFLDGEDQGRPMNADEFCRGSVGYARTLPARIEDGTAPIAGFVFDMVGDKDLDIYPEVVSSRRAQNLVTLVLDAAHATGAKHFHADERHALMDDHVPILNAGVPCVDIIDFDYAWWHTPADTPDKVSAESLAEVSRVAAWIVYASPLIRAPGR